MPDPRQLLAAGGRLGQRLYGGADAGIVFHLTPRVCRLIDTGGGFCARRRPLGCSRWLLVEAQVLKVGLEFKRGVPRFARRRLLRGIASVAGDAGGGMLPAGRGGRAAAAVSRIQFDLAHVFSSLSRAGCPP
jgi:hypothetical protein